VTGWTSARSSSCRAATACVYRQSRACLIYTLISQVQGVFFRKYTVAEAQRLGLVGCVRNTERGTVEGEAQGPPNELAAFKVQCTLVQSGQCNMLAQGTHPWLFGRTS